MKRVWSILLAAALLLSLIPAGAVEFAIPAKAATSGYYTYSVSNGKATITGVNTAISGDVVIPSTLGGYPVTSIGERAFSDCSSLTSIAIPDSVTSIGRCAFARCDALTSLTVEEGNSTYHSAGNCIIKTASKTLVVGCAGSVIPSDGSVTKIEDYAFRDCTSLTSITIPAGVTSIGEWAFSGCTSLTSITIPDSVTSISAYAFYHCTSLTSITIPDSVTSIGKDAFYYCTSLTSVTIGNGVTSIEYRAFSFCDALTSITIPDSVTSIGDWAFPGCTSLTSVTIGNGVTSIGERAFYDCNSLTSITIPDSVTSIGYYAFYYCTSLTSVTIGNGVTSIEYRAFSFCDALADVYYGGDESDRAKITIGDGNSSLINATWHYTCKHRNTTCGNVVDVTCTEDGYTGDTVCADCGELIVAGEIILATGHIYGGDNLCDVCGEDLLREYYVGTVTDGKVIITDVNTAISGKVVIPNVIDGYPVAAIGNNAFRDCKKITEIVIPASIESIGTYAFRNCTALTTVHFNAKNCTVMGSAVYLAFADCPALTTLYVGKEVTQIPANAFRGVASLTTLYMTKTTKVVNVNAFHTTALADVFYVGMASDFAAVDVKSYNNALKDAIFAYNTPCFTGCEWTADCDSLCEFCGASRVTTHANIVDDAAVAPTCTETGLTAGRHCAECGNILVKQTVIPATGHTWNEGTVTVEPTYESCGYKEVTCTVCGASELVEIEPLTRAEIRDGYYYYDGVKVPNAGLVQVHGAYYYVVAGGKLKTGRYAIFNTNGFDVESGIYYFFADGKMNTAEGVYEGYYFNEVGKLTPYAGLIEWNGAKYYLNNGGLVNAGGFFYISNLNGLLPKSCLRTFYPDGRMLEETRIYDGDGYYYENGARTPYAGMVEYEGHWYYVNDGGAYMKNKVQVLVNVNNSGLAKSRRCYFDAEGHMVYNTVVNGAFFGADGAAPDYAGVVKDNEGNLYYVNGVHGAVRKNATFAIAAGKTNGLCAAGKYVADVTGKLSPA